MDLYQYHEMISLNQGYMDGVTEIDVIISGAMLLVQHSSRESKVNHSESKVNHSV